MLRKQIVNNEVSKDSLIVLRETTVLDVSYTHTGEGGNVFARNAFVCHLKG